MARLLLLLLGVLRSAYPTRADLLVENAALRHQLGVLMRAGHRPRVRAADRRFWLILRRLWSRWSEALVFVNPDTVVRRHRAGFRLYWNWLSRRRRGGRPASRRGSDAMTHGPTAKVHGFRLLLDLEKPTKSTSKSARQKRLASQPKAK